MLFGSEIGALDEFGPYLERQLCEYKIVKSSISGKDVLVSSPHYRENAKFISQDEMKTLKFEPLDINEIKDVDSLLRAVNERIIYCGNKVFGKTQNAKLVDNCTNSSNAYYSHNIHNVKDVAYCAYVREAEGVFGASACPIIRYSMKCLEAMNAVRAFETYYSTNASDIYYSFNCSGCSNVMFGFNLRAKSNVIGNLELPRDKYLQVKAKLLAEIADELRKDKKVMSMADIANMGGKRHAEAETQVAPGTIPASVENAFRSTSKVVLGKEQQELGKFRKWLMKRALEVKKVKGALGTPAYKAMLPVVHDIPAEKLATMDEALASAGNRIDANELDSPSLNRIADQMGQKALFTMEFKEGHSENAVDVSANFNSNNVYCMWDATDSALSAFSSAVIKSKHIFGGYFRMLESNFCVNCYNSTSLSRCFEVDSSYSCSDTYFSHNCENVSDSMFCFNAKGLRYAIGNVEVGRENYMRVKKILLDYLSAHLDAGSRLDFDIFSL